MMKMLWGYPKKLWFLAIGLIINVTGTSFLWPLTTIYVSDVLGRSITTAGMVLLLQAAMGMVGSLLGGYLYDRIGGRRTILFGVMVAIVAVTLLAFFRIWSIYLLLMMILGFSNGIIPPAVYAMAGGVWPEGGRKAFNLMYVSQNVGVALGSALGGIVAQYSFRLTFLSNAFTYICFALLVWYGLNEHIASQPRGVEHQPREEIDKTKNRKGFIALIILCTGFAFTWITYVQWQTSISAYMHEMGYTLAMYSLLWTINGALILLFQPFSSVIVNRLLPSIRGQLLTGVIIFIASFIMVGQLQPLYSGFIIGMVIMTIGEIFIWPAVPNGAAMLAPEGKKGFYQGMVNTFATAGRMLGPLIGGLLYDHIHIDAMFYGMVGFLMLSLISFISYHRIVNGKSKQMTISR